MRKDAKFTCKICGQKQSVRKVGDCIDLLDLFLHRYVICRNKISYFRRYSKVYVNRVERKYYLFK